MIEKFEIGKLYKTNTPVSTNKKMLECGTIITVLKVEQENQLRFYGYGSHKVHVVKITFLYDNQILNCEARDDGLFNYFNEVKTKLEDHVF